ncbi:MAG: metallophosphoesterase [Algicola sp.]|nr:metallophosphoesterase [Algicola sp.]
MGWFTGTFSVTTAVQPLKIAQITDCHLLINGGTYEGVDSKARLQSVMVKLAEQTWDCVVVTGDVTQDHTLGSYEILADYCRLYLKDTIVAWLPGNHDDIDCLNRHFGQPPFTTAKHLKLGHWHVLMLNTKGPTPAGQVSAEHFDEITQVLNTIEPDESVLVFCHHHLLPVNGYIDKHIASNGELLLNLLKAHEQVKCIAHGHVHQQRQTILARAHYDDIYLWATPSTSVQFAVNSKVRGNDDSLGPAFRYFELGAGAQVLSDVIWCSSGGSTFRQAPRLDLA